MLKFFVKNTCKYKLNGNNRCLPHPSLIVSVLSISKYSNKFFRTKKNWLSLEQFPHKPLSITLIPFALQTLNENESMEHPIAHIGGLLCLSWSPPIE